MSYLSVRALPETLRTSGFAAITNAYVAIGAAFTSQVHFLMLVNTTDVLLHFSLNGVNDHFVLPAGSQMVLDVASNNTLPGGSFLFAKNTSVFVKQTLGAPSLGTVYLSSFYGYNPY